jgi:L-histidine N-alpha-methyltransferase
VKDVETLEAAYNDAEGVTAEFNLNVLRVMNRELDADFDLEAFEHVAFFDHDREWIEMRLRAQRRMDVRIGRLGLDLAFAAREEMRTEISAKFTPERLQGDLAAAALRPVEVMTDPDDLFALSLSERAAA